MRAKKESRRKGWGGRPQTNIEITKCLLTALVRYLIKAYITTIVYGQEMAGSYTVDSKVKIKFRIWEMANGSRHTLLSVHLTLVLPSTISASVNCVKKKEMVTILNPAAGGDGVIRHLFTRGLSKLNDKGRRPGEKVNAPLTTVVLLSRSLNSQVFWQANTISWEQCPLQTHVNPHCPACSKAPYELLRRTTLLSTDHCYADMCVFR